MRDALELMLEWRWAMLAVLWLCLFLGVAVWYARELARDRAERLARLDPRRLQQTLQEVAATYRLNRTRHADGPQGALATSVSTIRSTREHEDAQPGRDGGAAEAGQGAGDLEERAGVGRDGVLTALASRQPRAWRRSLSREEMLEEPVKPAEGA